MAPTVLLVDFLPDGRCFVVHPEPRAAGLEPRGHGFRCPIPYANFGRGAVSLRVSLPSGVNPATDSFPLLDWHRESAGWIGTAVVPSAPSFVSLHRGPAAVPGSASFGWNFYGFFVFAAAFIGVYFAWARHMHRRATRAPR